MKRHTPDTVSLVAGLFIVTLGALWLVDEIHTLKPQVIGLIYAGVFLMAALIGIVRAIKRPRSDEVENS